VTDHDRGIAVSARLKREQLRHRVKILECGTDATTLPPFHENADPFVITELGGTVDSHSVIMLYIRGENREYQKSKRFFFRFYDHWRRGGVHVGRNDL
jgi:hypothetical protein